MCRGTVRRDPKSTPASWWCAWLCWIELNSGCGAKVFLWGVRAYIGAIQVCVPCADAARAVDVTSQEVCLLRDVPVSADVARVE